MSKNRALFLDRDGVINVDHGYVYLPEQFEFIDGIFEFCLTAVELGYLIFVVTNQARDGRGYYTEAQFHACTQWMCDQFLLRGIKVTKVYFCPTHPDYGIGVYKCDSFFSQAPARHVITGSAGIRT